MGEHLVEDAVWSYATPLPESVAVAGLLCFDAAKVDVTVDGERLVRPISPLLADLLAG